MIEQVTFIITASSHISIIVKLKGSKSGHNIFVVIKLNGCDLPEIMTLLFLVMLCQKNLIFPFRIWNENKPQNVVISDSLKPPSPSQLYLPACAKVILQVGKLSPFVDFFLLLKRQTCVLESQRRAIKWVGDRSSDPSLYFWQSSEDRGRCVLTSVACGIWWTFNFTAMFLPHMCSSAVSSSRHSGKVTTGTFHLEKEGYSGGTFVLKEWIGINIFMCTLMREKLRKRDPQQAKGEKSS